MKKILVYGMTGNIGGIENYIMYQYRQFDESQIHIDFISAYRDVKIAFYDEIISRGSRVFDLSSPHKWKDFLRNHSGEYDIIIFNNTNPLELYMLSLVKEIGGFKKIIIHSHNAGLDQLGIMKKHNQALLLKRQEEFRSIEAELWACSRLAGEWMFGKNAEFTVIKNGISTEQFRFSESVRNEVRRELGFSDNDFVIGNIAKFGIQKNHKFLIEIFDRVSRIVPEAKLVLVGQNVSSICMLKQLTALRAVRRGILKRISFLGLRKDTDRLYQAMDAFVLPSLYEGLPVVGVEAQCSGLPCLFSDTITSEVRLLDSTEYFPIKPCAAAGLWARALREISMNKSDRNDAFLKVRMKGFDIKDETERVQQMLLEG